MAQLACFFLAGFGGGGETAPAPRAEGDEEAAAGDDEEECAAEFKPVVQLEEVEVQVRSGLHARPHQIGSALRQGTAMGPQ